MTMPWGRYRGSPIETLPLGYLAWILDEATHVTPELHDAVRAEIADRLDVRPTVRSVRALPDPSVGAAAGDLVQAGFREMARRCHPDHGGTDRDMRDLLAARDWLRTALRTGIAT